MIKHIESFFPGKSEDILELFRLTNVEIQSNLDSKEELLEALNKAAQSNYLRKPGSERWQIKDGDDLMKHREAIWKVLEHLGVIAVAEPKFKAYDHVFLLGALQSRVELRRKSLEDMVNKHHLKVDNTYLLGGKRPLQPEKESLGSLEGINTELDMMQRDWANHKDEMPQTLRDSAHFCVDAPMKWDEKLQKETRPNTQDTIVYAMQFEHIVKQIKSQGHLGKVLVISNQPFCLYQDAIVRGVLPEGTLIDTVGSPAEESIELGVALDSIARWIYATRENFKMKQTLSEAHTDKVAPSILTQFVGQSDSTLHQRNHDLMTLKSSKEKKTLSNKNVTV